MEKSQLNWNSHKEGNEGGRQEDEGGGAAKGRPNPPRALEEFLRKPKCRKTFDSTFAFE